MPTFDINILNDITILYVEDEAGLREQELRAYSKLFKNVYSCKDGEEALDVFKKNYSEIDIIITDINMPKLSGLELAKKVKEFSDVPIILTTAYQNKEYLISAIDLGIKKYITKPINIKEVVEDIQFVVTQNKKEHKIKDIVNTLLKESSDNENQLNSLLNKNRKLTNALNKQKDLAHKYIISTKLNKDGIIVDLSNKFALLLQYDYIELVTKHINTLKDANNKNDDDFHNYVTKLKNSNDILENISHNLKRKDGTVVNLIVDIEPEYSNLSNSIEYYNLYFTRV